jgi:hypothetical protein
MKKNLLLLFLCNLVFNQNYSVNYFKKACHIIKSNRFYSITEAKSGFDLSLCSFRCLKSLDFKYSVLSACLATIKCTLAYRLWNKQENEEQDELDLKLSLVENTIGFYFIFSIPTKTKEQSFLEVLKFVQLSLSSFLAAKKLISR